MNKLPRSFYDRDTVAVARDLLGTYLVHMVDGLPLVCRLTETEAYVGRMDKACHAYNYHKTARNAAMFAPPGHAYIYLIYGMHCCLNLVCEKEGEPSAVLLRGMEPVYQLERQSQLRYGKGFDELTPCQKRNFGNGPGKLCKAMGLNRSQNGLDLLGDELFVCSSLPELGLEASVPAEIKVGKRIGIDYAEEAVDFPWRFTL